MIRNLQSDLFVDQILIDYSYCSGTLDQTRNMLFETLRGSSDFSFGNNCELKRRVMTRSKNGNSIAVKLANGIYKLLMAIGGGDVSMVKELISSSKKSSRSVPSSSLGKHSMNPIISTCSAEMSIVMYIPSYS